MGFSSESQPSVTGPSKDLKARALDIISILVSIVPKLQLILVDNDRINSAVTSISTNVIGPTIRSKGFPANASNEFLGLLHQLTRVLQAAKTWKKDIIEAFMDQKFFGSAVNLVKQHWLPILQQLTQNDKDRMP